MNRIFDDLKELDTYLIQLYNRHGGKGRKGGRIDGKLADSLSKQEHDAARRTAEVFFEYKGVIYGLAGDTTFDATKRFREKLSQAIHSDAVFIETKTRSNGKTESRTRCLHLGKQPNEPDGWYCYEASYFNNWSDPTSEKAA